MLESDFTKVILATAGSPTRWDQKREVGKARRAPPAHSRARDASASRVPSLIVVVVVVCGRWL